MCIIMTVTIIIIVTLFTRSNGKHKKVNRNTIISVTGDENELLLALQIL
jgi:hypothetical protein